MTDAEELFTTGDYPACLRLVADTSPLNAVLCQWLQSGASDASTRRCIAVCSEMHCSSTNALTLEHYTHVLAYMHMCAGQYQYAAHYCRLAIELANVVAPRHLHRLHRLRLAIACADNMYMQPLAIDEVLSEWHGDVPYADSIRRLLMRVLVYMSVGARALKAAHLVLRVIHARPNEIRSLPPNIALCLQLTQARYAVMTGEKHLSSQHLAAAHAILEGGKFTSPLARRVAGLHEGNTAAGLSMVGPHCDYCPLLASQRLNDVGREHEALERQWAEKGVIGSETPSSSQYNVLANARWALTHNRALSALFGGQWGLALRLYAYMLQHRPANYVLWMRYAQCCILRWNERHAYGHCYHNDELGDAATFTVCECGQCLAPHSMATPYTGQGRLPQMSDMHKALNAIRTARALLDRKVPRFDPSSTSANEHAEATAATEEYITGVNGRPVDRRHEETPPSARHFTHPAMLAYDAPFMRHSVDELMRHRVYIYTTEAYCSLMLGDSTACLAQAQRVVGWADDASHVMHEHVSPTWREIALTYSANANMQLGRVEMAKRDMRAMRPIDRCVDTFYHSPPRPVHPPPPPGFPARLQSYGGASVHASGTAYRPPSIVTCVAHNAGVLHEMDGDAAKALQAIRQAKVPTRPLHTHVSLSTQLTEHYCAVQSGESVDGRMETVVASRRNPYNMPVLLKEL